MVDGHGAQGGQGFVPCGNLVWGWWGNVIGRLAELGAFTIAEGVVWQQVDLLDSGQRAESQFPASSRAPKGHIAQRPQCTHSEAFTMHCGWRCQVSGLWHQAHRSGHPLKNTVVRIPGPSFTEKGRISVINPCVWFIFSAFL